MINGASVAFAVPSHAKPAAQVKSPAHATHKPVDHLAGPRAGAGRALAADTARVSRIAAAGAGSSSLSDASKAALATRHVRRPLSPHRRQRRGRERDDPGSNPVRDAGRRTDCSRRAAPNAAADRSRPGAEHRHIAHLERRRTGRRDATSARQRSRHRQCHRPACRSGHGGLSGRRRHGRGDDDCARDSRQPDRCPVTHSHRDGSRPTRHRSHGEGVATQDLSTATDALTVLQMPAA